MDEESRDMYNAWNAPVKLGVFINPEANQEESDKASKRADTPFHPGGSGSGSGDSYFTADSAKRDKIPKHEQHAAKTEELKQENVKKSTIETNEKKSELSAKATNIEEVQGSENKEKVPLSYCMQIHRFQNLLVILSILRKEISIEICLVIPFHKIQINILIYNIVLQFKVCCRNLQ